VRVDLVAGVRVTATVTATLGAARALHGEATVGAGLDDLAGLLRRGRAGLRAVPVEADARVGPFGLLDGLAAAGLEDRGSGTVRGELHVTGTLGAPTGALSLEIRDVRAARAELERLGVEAAWDGRTATLAAIGEQRGGGRFRADAEVTRLRPVGVVGAAVARGFEVAPFAHLLPPRFRGIAGVVDGKLELDTTHDPPRFTGRLRARGVRAPIAEQVGTLRAGTLALVARPGRVELELDGRVGAGTVRVRGRAELDGIVPRSAVVTASADGATLIGAVEPELHGKLRATLRREADHWRVDVKVGEARVKLRDVRSNALHPAGAPDDLVIVSGGKRRAAEEVEARRRRARTRPLGGPAFAMVHVEAKRIEIDAPELRGRFAAELRVAIGDGIAIEGTVEAPQGAIELFDRTYFVERGALAFDGTTNARLDIRISHELPELTLYAEVAGRLDKPELRLSSRPPIYTETQLLAFLLGGTPGLETGGEAQQAAAGVASTILARKVKELAGEVLPVSIDVLRYDAASTDRSAAVTIGTWVSPRMLLAYRLRVEAHPDENTGEAQVEYWLRTGIVLNVVAGDRGHHDADLLWIKRW
jgi:autotransporter translocation and assembly factor TamB